MSNRPGSTDCVEISVGPFSTKELAEEARTELGMDLGGLSVLEARIEEDPHTTSVKDPDAPLFVVVVTMTPETASYGFGFLRGFMSGMTVRQRTVDELKAALNNLDSRVAQLTKERDDLLVFSGLRDRDSRQGADHE